MFRPVLRATFVPIVVFVLVSCSEDDPTTPGATGGNSAAGSGGSSAGTSGTSGNGGSSGTTAGTSSGGSSGSMTAGSGGTNTAGTSGTGGSSGTAGTGAIGGTGGTGGSAATGGTTTGGSAGTGAIGGTGGIAGTGGVGGSAGTGALAGTGGVGGSGPTTCNPLAQPGQQGCNQGEKCTWVIVQDNPDILGEIACVPDGIATLGQACTAGPAGPTTGYDDCVSGTYCINSVCKDLCGFDGSLDAACNQGEACVRYAGIGANGTDDPLVGACQPTCDPLTQTQIENGMTTSCGAGKGCYLLASTVDTIAVCAGAGTPVHNEPIVGITYANSCAPGHMPRVAVQGTTSNECAALCKPADVYMGHNEQYEGGDSTYTNWLNMPATCESAGGPSVAPGVPVTGESCSYYWTRELSSGLTNFSNTVGWCFNYASWKYDPDGMDPVDNTADYPRCPTLTTGEVIPPADGNDALYFGCIAKPAAPPPPPGHEISNATPERSPVTTPRLMDRLAPTWRK